MKHFTIEDEIDFVNEVVPATRKLTMEEHLKGCKRCTKEVSQWRQVRESVAADANYQPPAEALRIAKAAFAGLQLALRGETDGSIEVVFDSLLQPSVEGFRSAGGGTRHVLYRADPFQIDLQVELQPGDKRVVVTGQLLGSLDPQIVGRDVALILANMHGRVVRTVTNQFGEFREEIENSGDLALVFYQADQKPLVISLRDALSHPTSSENAADE
jgi:hypothetical protein